MLHIQLKVKFRWLFDFGSVNETLDVAVNAPLPTFDKVVYDRRGIYLRVYTD